MVIRRKISIDEIIERYVNGESSTKIAEIAGISDRSVRRILVENGVKTRPAGQPRKRDVDESFFDTWSNDMAYILGVIVTDGCVHGNTLSISQKDYDYLKMISEKMGCNNPYIMRKKDGVCVLIINSKHIILSLQAYGIIPRKSLVIEFPNVPEQYLGHFLRGVFDGDGYIHPKGYIVVFTSGSKNFAYGLFGCLKEYGFQTRVCEDTEGYYRIIISGKDDVIRFGHWIYDNDNDLSLKRKKSVFNLIRK
jgi:intein-encoded DNA endonuclease-like protein